MLREFLYLDSSLVDQYLAQVEGGLYDNELERLGDASSRASNAELDAGVGQDGGRQTTSRSEEVERVRRQTPESRYNRLHDALDGNFLALDESSSNVFDQLQVRQMVSADCYVDIPSMSRTLANAPALEGVADLMRMFAPEKLNGEAEKALGGLAKLSAISNGDVVATGELGDGEAKLAFKLSQDALRVPLEELEGEAMIIGRVQKKWPEGQRYSLLNIPGLNMMSREDRRKMEKKTKTENQAQGTFVEGPGASLSVVAIFR
jgi:hypothetical protein